MIPYDWAATNLKKLTAKMYPYKHKHCAPIKRSKKPLTSGGAAVECPGAPVEYRGAAVECPGAAVEPAVGPGPDPGAPLT